MNPHAIFVPGEPKAQPRAKGRSMGALDCCPNCGEDLPKVFTKIYTPSTADDWKFSVAALSGPMKRYPIDGPSELGLQFWMPRPKNHYRTGKFAGLLKESAPTWHAQKPDADNLCKSTMDALNKLAYPDDSSVCRLIAEKRFVPQGAKPGCSLRLRELSEEEAEVTAWPDLDSVPQRAPRS